MDKNIVAKVIAGEAGGEGEIGMRAVACVIANRCRLSHRTPKEIVTAPKQFSCLALPEMMERNYQEVKEIADKIASTIMMMDYITRGAENYCTAKLYYSQVRPKWISGMQVTAIIGNHIFMKPKDKNA
jgi:spore germination cell wall hydrolase CwlJ-like protein